MVLLWEAVKSELLDKNWLNQAPAVIRAKVPGGWLVKVTGPGDNAGAFFYPDPEHTWDGSSLP